MLKKEAYKAIRQQLQQVADLVEKEDPKVFALMEPAYSKISALCFIPNNITAERLEDARETLHIMDSIIAGMDKHGAEEMIEHDFFWNYLYGVHDHLKNDLTNGYYENETETEGDINGIQD